MKKFAFATAVSAIALLSGAGAANAADIYGGVSAKDAPATANYLPQGAYISFGAGGALTDSNLGNGFSPSDFNFGGFLGEARVGYDFVTPGTPWILGAFVGGSYEGVNGHALKYTPSSYTPASVTGLPSGTSASTVTAIGNALTNGITTTATFPGTVTIPAGITYTPASYSASSLASADANQHWGWESGIRIGRIFNGSSLVYALVAYQGQDISAGGKSATLDGVKVGGGLEIDLKNGWAFGSEVDWVWYGTWTPAAGVNVNEDELRATARLLYRFH